MAIFKILNQTIAPSEINEELGDKFYSYLMEYRFMQTDKTYGAMHFYTVVNAFCDNLIARDEFTSYKMFVCDFNKFITNKLTDAIEIEKMIISDKYYQNSLAGLIRATKNIPNIFGIRDIVDELINKKNEFRYESTLQEMLFNEINWYDFNKYRIEKEHKGSRNDKYDLYVTSKDKGNLIIELKKGTLIKADYCQAIRYSECNDGEVVLLCSTVTDNVLDIIKDDKIAIYTYNPVFAIIDDVKQCYPSGFEIEREVGFSSYFETLINDITDGEDILFVPYIYLNRRNNTNYEAEETRFYCECKEFADTHKEEY